MVIVIIEITKLQTRHDYEMTNHIVITLSLGWSSKINKLCLFPLIANLVLTTTYKQF